MSAAICEGFVKMVEALEAFRAVPDAVCLVEDRTNPRTLAQRYAAHRLRVLVAAVAHERRAGTGGNSAGAWTVQATVFENATRRADGEGVPTLTDVAVAMRDGLHWQTSAGARLVYQDMTRLDGGEEELRMVVTFKAYDVCGSVAWGAGDALLSGDVTSAVFARGGVNVFEPSRAGDARYVGTRDRHWRVDLTALAAVADPDLLPDFGERFSYGGRSYVTESAVLALEGEDVGFVKLSGRTTPAAEHQ